MYVWMGMMWGCLLFYDAVDRAYMSCMSRGVMIDLGSVSLLCFSVELRLLRPTEAIPVLWLLVRCLGQLWGLAWRSRARGGRLGPLRRRGQLGLGDLGLRLAGSRGLLRFLRGVGRPGGIGLGRRGFLALGRPDGRGRRGQLRRGLLLRRCRGTLWLPTSLRRHLVLPAATRLGDSRLDALMVVSSEVHEGDDAPPQWWRVGAIGVGVRIEGARRDLFKHEVVVVGQLAGTLGHRLPRAGWWRSHGGRG